MAGTPRVLRAMNDRAALDLLLEHGTLSRTRIGKLTGLSKPTASQLLARLEAAGLTRADVHRLVIGTPGAFDPNTGRLRYASHLPGWHSPTLLGELAAALPMPVEYENDVNLVAAAEQRLGAARGHEDFVLLWNQEGLGAALVLGGRLHRGWTGGAGEVGFLPVPGTPLVRQVTKANSGGYQELAGSQVLPALAREAGLPDLPAGSHAETAAALLTRAVRHPDDERHQRLLRAYATRLATGLASLVSVLDPELVVLSGTSLTCGGEPLRALVQAELAELAAARPRLVVGAVTEHPVLRGALESALATTRDEVFDTSR
ncbi:MAG TPA: ROK family transcriptional regulator [Streptomyces sp.]|nr:ROK family transcriptional regulator [Streptomyces sp.]